MIRPICIAIGVFATILITGQVTGLKAQDIHPFRALPITSPPYSPGLASALPSMQTSINPATHPMEYSLPYDGLIGYVEIGSIGLPGISAAASVLSSPPQSSARIKRPSINGDVFAYLMSQPGLLLKARIAIAFYIDNDPVALIELSTSAEAQRFVSDVAFDLNLLPGENILAAIERSISGPGSTGQNGILFISKDGESIIGSAGRLVIIGDSLSIQKLAFSDTSKKLGEVPEFRMARQKFPTDPLFCYIESSVICARMAAAQSNPYAKATAFAALVNAPRFIAVGGTIGSDLSSAKALLVYNSKQIQATFSSIFAYTAYTASATSKAANFIPDDSSLFASVSLNWEKILDVLQSSLPTISSAADANKQSAPKSDFDLLKSAEETLGFSIRDDLLPTLGNEAAVAFEMEDATRQDLNYFPARPAPSSKRRPVIQQTAPSPKFTLILSLKDPAKFEMLFLKFFKAADREGMTGKGRQTSFTPALYRGCTIKYRSELAYTIKDGCFIIEGSAAAIRKSLDANLLGGSLGVKPEFNIVAGSSGRALMRLYLSPGLMEALTPNPARRNLQYAGEHAKLRAGVGLVMRYEPDGLTIEARLPTELLVSSLWSLFQQQQPSKVESPGNTPSTVKRISPRLTTEDTK